MGAFDDEVIDVPTGMPHLSELQAGTFCFLPRQTPEPSQELVVASAIEAQLGLIQNCWQLCQEFQSPQKQQHSGTGAARHVSQWPRVC